ncbi:DUF4097 family beta strand repeat-containing protein [Lacticaseibacillus sp. N501-2]|uniref:DUF4097 family beta strand repeat-containing protein n=1 Tax=Lacticaseibacillus salsurae TaxID=3367729 RepID=UPI0038B2C670
MTRKHLLIASLIIIVVAVLAVFGWRHYAADNITFDDGIKLSHRTQKTIALKDFDTLTVDLHDSDLTLQQGAKAAIKVVSGKQNQPTITQQDGHLTLKNSANHDDFDDDDDEAEPHIVLTVPNPLALKAFSGTLEDSEVLFNSPVHVNKLALTLRDGDLSAHHLRVDSGSLTSHDGDVKLTDSHLTALTFNSVDGDLDMQGGSVVGGRFITRDGDQSFSATTFQQAVTLQSDDGDLSIHGASKAWGYQLSTTDGHIRWFEQTHPTAITQNPQASPKLHATTYDGSITID